MGNVKSAKSYKPQQKGKPEVFFGFVELQFPMAVAGGPQKGHIFVTDYVNNNIQIYDGNKDVPILVKTFRSKGDGEGQFLHPCGIAVNSSGDIIVADTGNNRVQIFDSYWVYKNQFGYAGPDDGQFISPYGVACDSQDNIYVSDYFNGNIQVFDPTGQKFIRQIGKVASEPGLLYDPTYMAVSGDKLYVADKGDSCVKVYSTMGEFLFSFSACGKGKFMKCPTGIAVDPKSGLVVVGDSGNNRIDIFEPDGKFVAFYGSKGDGYGQFNGIGGLAVVWEGCLAVADLGNKRIELFFY